MKDDGWKSRKLWMALLAMVLILVGFIACRCDHALYGDYCMAILAAAGLYKAANVVDGRKPRPPAP